MDGWTDKWTDGRGQLHSIDKKMYLFTGPPFSPFLIFHGIRNEIKGYVWVRGSLMEKRADGETKRRKIKEKEQKAKNGVSCRLISIDQTLSYNVNNASGPLCK